MADPRVLMPPPRSPASRTSVSSPAASEQCSEASFPASVKSDAFSSAVKLEIRAISGDRCWACTTTLPQACHIMAKTDAQVKKWMDAGLVTSKLTGLSNGVVLCPTCHARFDNTDDPGYVFYPTDIDFFIDWEINDQLQRQTSPRPRKVPSAEAYKFHQVRQGRVGPNDIGGLFQPVFLENYLVGGKVHDEVLRDLTAPKTWHGDPILTFRKAFLVLGGLTATALEPDVCAKLQRLRDLYFGAGIRGSNLGSKESKKGPESDFGEHDDKPLKKPRHETLPSTGTPNPPAHGDTTGSRGAWTYGPSCTSEKVVHRYAQMIVKNPS